MKPLRKLIIPLVLLISAIFLRADILRLLPDYGQLFNWLPGLILSAALILCLSFNQSRILTVSITMLLVYILMQSNLLQTPLSDPKALMTYTSISLVVPITALILLFISERGFKNRHGLLVISITPIQLILVFLFYLLIPEQSLIYFINTYMPIKPVNGYILSITASWIYHATFIIGLFKLSKTNDEADVSILIGLLFSYATLAMFDRAEISTCVFSAAGIALIISILRSSYNMAYRDDLTGLLGRRALNVQLKGLGKQYVIAMTDIDHFKKFNDKFGHETGDNVLKMVAKKLDAVQGGGTAYRYGGEEFCILFPGKTMDHCEPFLEALRKKVENHELTVRNLKYRPKSAEVAMERRGRRSGKRNNKTVNVTISIGAAERNDKISKANEVLKAADKALYKAKESGRNCLQLSLV